MTDINFDGIENFRDFGGYATASGHKLAAGRLFRSANHAYATDEDLAKLRDLGVAVIVDLRSAVDAYQRQLVLAALARHQDNWAAAARELGLDRANLHRLAVRLGLK